MTGSQSAIASFPHAADGRREGYAPLRDYAAVGDGRTLALIARDGSVDWLCLPDLDSPSVLGGLLDSERGGRFELAPEGPSETRRRYVPDTNVLETTFTTATGVVRVTDAMLLPGRGLVPERELARRVDGLAGEVPMRWRVEPRFGYSGWRTDLGWRLGVPVATSSSHALAVCSWDAGSPTIAGGAVGGRFTAREGSSALLDLAAAHQAPLVLPGRDDVEERLAGTIEFWQGWARERRYEGPWRDAVVRSALALKLLIHSPSGAIAAAGTTSLPETLGGERNWDYRYSWIRDSSFTLDALLRIGCPSEGSAFFWWLLHASQLTHPDVRIMYRLDGRTAQGERELPLDGYRGSRPVRLGNEAVKQRQHDIYGHLFTTASVYHEAGGEFDRDTGRRLAETADLVGRSWREPDAGIWEVRGPRLLFTESKMMCCIALERAAGLAERGAIPGGNAAQWLREAEAIRAFVDERCWSPTLGSYTRSADATDVDASLLLGVLLGYAPAEDSRLRATTQRVADELANGALVHRYRAADGLPGQEGAFLACSFWLAEAFARQGRLEEAVALIDRLLELSGDVGLYAEEIEPDTGAFLGNFPQGLVHLALINAAAAVEEAGR